GDRARFWRPGRPGDDDSPREPASAGYSSEVQSGRNRLFSGSGGPVAVNRRGRGSVHRVRSRVRTSLDNALPHWHAGRSAIALARESTGSLWHRWTRSVADATGPRIRLLF